MTIEKIKTEVQKGGMDRVLIVMKDVSDNIRIYKKQRRYEISRGTVLDRCPKRFGKIRKVNDAMFMSKKKNCAFL